MHFRRKPTIRFVGKETKGGGGQHSFLPRFSRLSLSASRSYSYFSLTVTHSPLPYLSLNQAQEVNLFLLRENFRCPIHILSSHKRGPRTSSFNISGCLLEIQNLRPDSRPTEPESAF